MRVIAGTAKARRLETLQGQAVRPTADRVKEAVFSVIQFDIQGRRVLDLFAGSGALGIEALSRGAKSVAFVDISPQAVEVVRRNLETVGLAQKAAVHKGNFESFLNVSTEIFDIVFLDPPYRKNLIPKALPLLADRLSDYGMVICEYAADEQVPETTGALNAVKTYRYGKTRVAVYRKPQGTPSSAFRIDISRKE